jgi:nicotinate dehydrogenase subunit B
VSEASPPPRSRREYLEASDTLVIVKNSADGAALELFLVLDAAGRITAFNGHVDLGTGIRTALAQIVAEELDVATDRVTMVLGDSELAPDQGPTIASETIQVSAQPLRRAAAQARRFLLELAANRWGVASETLCTDAGRIFRAQGDRASGCTYASLLVGRCDRLPLADCVPLKAVADYRVVGRSVPRVDIAAKATGEASFVHDLRLPGMLHGRVVRPPYVGMDSGPFVGTSLVSVDETSITGLSGIVALVVLGDFVGLVAEREEQAAAAAERLVVNWKPVPTAFGLENVHAALSAQPSRPRTLADRGDVERRLGEACLRMPRTYLWPYQLHASIGPSCAVADWREHGLKVWSGTQNPLPLRADLALLLGMPETSIELIRLESAGCYGRNCADDVTADAALLSRSVGRPVRVQLTREQEHLWEPKGAAQVMEVDGGLAADGSVAAYDFATRYPSNAAPTLALLLTGAVAPVATVSEMGDRTAIPPYAYEHLRVVVHDLAPIVRASWLRGVSAMPNSFAHESYIDELAASAGVDPVEFRLRHLDDERAAALIRAVAERAGWQSHTGPRGESDADGKRRGQGFAYAQYRHGKFPGTAAAWSAWVAEVQVDTDSGDVHVSRVVVGQDSGLVINPAGVQHQIHGNVLQSISRTLHEEVRFSGTAGTSREWGSYPILRFDEVPVVNVLMMERPHDPPLGVGESVSVPSAAAIANAIFDATGLRLREPPFTPERVRAAWLAQPGAPATAVDPANARPRTEGSEELARLRAHAPPPQVVPLPVSRWRRLGLVAGGILSLITAAFLWRGALAPTAPPDAELYSAAAIARGRELAAVGDCAVCHTADGGAAYAGGRALHTVFGTIYTTNITPDPATGIGAWSYAAFERAMREGVHRDGRRLYPAFPYTAFTRTTDQDLQALYAYLSSRPPVPAVAPATRLSPPFAWRPLLAFWNALFLERRAFAADPARSDQWNRGAYLVEGLGHCAACHSPRNALGATIGGARHLSGGYGDGWEAPPLTSRSLAPIAWDEAELYRYLKTGSTLRHGAAAGPMQAVVRSLAGAADADVRAMAHYIAGFNAALGIAEQGRIAEILEARAQPAAERAHRAGARLFAGACAACHEPAAGVLAAARPSLALNTNLHSADPTNVLRAVLDGVDVPGLAHLGAMPGFRQSLDDAQLAQLLGYLRARFAAEQSAWPDLEATAARLRR